MCVCVYSEGVVYVHFKCLIVRFDIRAPTVSLGHLMPGGCVI